MKPDNEVDMAVSSMLNGKHPLAALSRLTNNMTSFLKHSVHTISSHLIMESISYFHSGTYRVNNENSKRSCLVTPRPTLSLQSHHHLRFNPPPNPPKSNLLHARPSQIRHLRRPIYTLIAAAPRETEFSRSYGHLFRPRPWRRCHRPSRCLPHRRVQRRRRCRPWRLARH